MQFTLIDYLNTSWSSLLVLIKKDQTSLGDLFYYFWRVKINILFYLSGQHFLVSIRTGACGESTSTEHAHSILTKVRNLLIKNKDSTQY